MKMTELRPCDACGAEINAVLYAVTVQQMVTAIDLEHLQPVEPALDLQLCIRCGCGLNTHALPLAIENRSQALDKEKRNGR